MTELLVTAEDTFRRRYGRYLLADADGPTVDTEDARLMGGTLCSEPPPTAAWDEQVVVRFRATSGVVHLENDDRGEPASAA